jgi:hypothetical protein
VPSSIDVSITTLDGAPVYSGVVRAATSGAVADARASFEVEAGRLLVQMAIHDLSAAVIDRDVRDIIVGGFPEPVALGTPEVLRARTAREQRENAGNPDAIPVASRTFSRRERLLVRVPVVASQQASVSAQLASSFGSVMTELPAAGTPGRRTTYQFDIPLAPYAAGTYTVQITASTAAGSARESVTFRVTP